MSDNIFRIEDGVLVGIANREECPQNICIPNGVKEIGECAFRGCRNLETIVIPNGVTRIGDFAFRGCVSLKSVTLPDSVTKIGVGAFPENVQIIRR